MTIIILGIRGFRDNKSLKNMSKIFLEYTGLSFPPVRNMYFYSSIGFSMNNGDMIDIDHEIESRKGSSCAIEVIKCDRDTRANR